MNNHASNDVSPMARWGMALAVLLFRGTFELIQSGSLDEIRSRAGRGPRREHPLDDGSRRGIRRHGLLRSTGPHLRGRVGSQGSHAARFERSRVEFGAAALVGPSFGGGFDPLSLSEHVVEVLPTEARGFGRSKNVVGESVDQC